MNKFPHGIEYKNGTIFFPHSACAICYCDDNLLLVRQKRKERITLELPGGVCRLGEDIVESALRELKEESGYIAKSGHLLLTLDLDTSSSIHKTSLVIAENISDGEKSGEFITEWYNIEDLIKFVEIGTITHAPTIVAIFYLYKLHM